MTDSGQEFELYVPSFKLSNLSFDCTITGPFMMAEGEGRVM